MAVPTDAAVLSVINIKSDTDSFIFSPYAPSTIGDRLESLYGRGFSAGCLGDAG